MTSLVRVGIAGTGSHVPERVVTNAFFEGILDTSNEWIVQRTGIERRRWVAENEATSDLCIPAARRALEAAGVAAADLDLIVVGTVSPDNVLPAVSVLVQREIGASKAAAFDLNSACTGFMTALTTAEAFVAAGRARNALVIGAESLSRFIDLKDRTSCILFGDGAGAAVLRPVGSGGRGEILRRSMGADGTGYDLIHMVGGGSRKPSSHETVDNAEHAIRVKGRDVFRFAVQKMVDCIEEMMQGHSYDELTLLVPHQVNRRIIDAALERLGWSDEKVAVNIQEYGNTSAASVPIALDEAVRAGRVEQGKLVVLVAFGAGLTWGGALVRW